MRLCFVWFLSFGCTVKGTPTEENCRAAEAVVEDCLDSICGVDDGPFCRCDRAGGHFDRVFDPSGGPSTCDCLEGSFWEEVGERVCYEQRDEPTLDCDLFARSIRRLEASCE